MLTSGSAGHQEHLQHQQTEPEKLHFDLVMNTNVQPLKPVRVIIITRKITN